MEHSLQQIFPVTLELLSERKIDHLKQQFKRTASEELMLTSTADSSRWFPVFLKVQGVRSEILEVAEFEYVKHNVKTIEIGHKKSPEQVLKLNPSVQFIELHHDQPKLDRQAGLYCFFKRAEDFFEMQLDLQEALIIDLLHEERKYNFNQIIEMACIHNFGKKYPKTEWEEILKNMIELGLIN